MRRNFDTRVLSLLPICLLLASSLFGCATGQQETAGVTPTTSSAIDITKQPVKVSTETRPAGTRSDLQPLVVPYYPPPDKMELCGEPVPLHNREVYERLDREFTVVVYNHAQVYLWLKRMERYFPFFEERLRYYNLPDDLKYVAIIESDLLPNACSPKGAAGPWQFMASTACSYGLNQKGSCDERYDFELATDCAFRFMSDLYKRYKNWTLAIATYNCGDKRIQDQMRTLQTTDYYQMSLPQETERYIFRLLAVKAVLGNPSQYGYILPKGQGYPALRTDRVNIKLSSPVSIHGVAATIGSTYREVKMLNPVFRGDEIPAGEHELKLPEGTGKVFEQQLGAIPKANSIAGESGPVDELKPSLQQESSPSRTKAAVTPARAPLSSAEAKEAKDNASSAKSTIQKPEPARSQAKRAAAAQRHIVKKGETLSNISQRYNVSSDELRKANKLKGSKLSPGQKLVIP